MKRIRLLHYLSICGVLGWAGMLVASEAPHDEPAPRPVSGTLLVVNQIDSSLSLIDLDTGRSAATLPTGNGPHEVAVSPDGRLAAVSNYGFPVSKTPGKTLTVIDISAMSVKTTLTLGAYTMPHGVAWLDRERVVCTSETGKAALVINVNSGIIERSLVTDQEGSHMVAVSPDRARVYVTNVGSQSVSILDLMTGKDLGPVEADHGCEGLALSPDGRRLWTGNRLGQTLSVIDTTTKAKLRDLPSSGLPFRLAFTPDGKTVAVTNALAGSVVFYDAENLTERGRTSLLESPVKFETPGPPPVPVGIAVHPNGRVVYTTVYHAGAVGVIDLNTFGVIGTLPAGQGADGIAFSPVAVAKAA